MNPKIGSKQMPINHFLPMDKRDLTIKLRERVDAAKKQRIDHQDATEQPAMDNAKKYLIPFLENVLYVENLMLDVASKEADLLDVYLSWSSDTLDVTCSAYASDGVFDRTLNWYDLKSSDQAIVAMNLPSVKKVFEKHHIERLGILLSEHFGVSMWVRIVSKCRFCVSMKWRREKDELS